MYQAVIDKHKKHEDVDYYNIRILKWTINRKYYTYKEHVMLSGS